MKFDIKSLGLTVTLLALGSLMGQSDAAVTVIDFNDGPSSGTDIGDFYASVGVVFTNGEWGALSGFTPHPGSSGLMLGPRNF